MIYTTLAKIRAHHPCESGWTKLLKHLGKTRAGGARLSLATILKSNGVADALWCLRACDDADVFARRFALDMAKRVYPIWRAKYPNDARVKNCINVVERFLRGAASKEELRKARAAAFAAAYAAADAADAAAYAAAERKWQSGHLAACLKAWPNGEWPKVTPIKVGG